MLVGVLLPGAVVDWRDPLGELASLAEAAGAHVVDRMVQRRQEVDAALFIGRGKAEELRERVSRHGADVVIFDNDLSPSQIRNLEQIAGVKVLDRSELILDIFASRARTKQARLQVELAQLEYTAPRLRGMWSHLERIAGAAGGSGAGVVGGIGTRGPGERQIEIDRRLVHRRIVQLRRELASIDLRRQREVASRRDMFTVCLVGYTNAGKSTLMRALTGARVPVQDRLFSTLDTKTSRWSLGRGRVVLLSDTVGFVRDIPHHLVASFKATLEEALHADLLLHVVDASSPLAEAQVEAVRKVLAELHVEQTPTITVLNKMDAVEDVSVLQVLESRLPLTVRVSARRGEGLEGLREMVDRIYRREHRLVDVATSSGNGRVLAFLDQHGQVISKQFGDGEVRVRARVSPANLARVREMAGEEAVAVVEESEMAGSAG